jgi:hypothetical protein
VKCPGHSCCSGRSSPLQSIILPTGSYPRTHSNTDIEVLGWYQFTSSPSTGSTPSEYSEYRVDSYSEYSEYPGKNQRTYRQAVEGVQYYRGHGGRNKILGVLRTSTPTRYYQSSQERAFLFTPHSRSRAVSQQSTLAAEHSRSRATSHSLPSRGLSNHGRVATQEGVHK